MFNKRIAVNRVTLLLSTNANQSVHSRLSQRTSPAMTAIHCVREVDQSQSTQSTQVRDACRFDLDVSSTNVADLQRADLVRGGSSSTSARVHSVDAVQPAPRTLFAKSAAMNWATSTKFNPERGEQVARRTPRRPLGCHLLIGVA